MRFWWASQGKNFRHVAHLGGFWTCPPANGHRRRDRELIKELQPGDWVFHYAHGNLRAVSEVTSAWRDFSRPVHYPPREGEGDDGWLVTSDPILTRLEIPISQLMEVVSHGSPGPLNAQGSPMQKFLSRLAAEDAAGLIRLVDAKINPPADSGGATRGPVWTGGSTSVLREMLARREQAALREHLLGGRSQARCALCSRNLPAELLVAAHIVPRHLLDEEQRKDLGRIAMLACTLGCDVLFERGYLAVDDTGAVQDLAPTAHPDVAAVTRELAGRPCAAYSDSTAEKFAAHRARAEEVRTSRVAER